jgi:integrase
MPRRRSPGEGSIRNRLKTRGSFEAAVVVGYLENGNPKRISQSFPTKAAAQDWLLEQQNKLKSGTLAISKLTVAEFAAEWLALAKRRCRANTYNSYYAITRDLITPFLGEHVLTALAPIHISRWIMQLQEKTTPYLVHKAHTYLSMILEEATRLELIARNPAKRSRPPKPRRRDLTRWSPAEAAAALLWLAESNLETLYYYVCLGLATGMRKEELLGLRWIDIDEDAFKIQIRQTVAYVAGKAVFGEPKTESSKRDIYFKYDVLEVFRRQRKLQCELATLAGDKWKEYDLVFTSLVGTPIPQKTLRRWWDRMIEGANVTRIRIYDLRSTWGSTEAALGTNPKAISDRFGHVDAKFTMQTYIRPDLDEMQATAKPLLELYGFPLLLPPPAAELRQASEVPDSSNSE